MIFRIVLCLVAFVALYCLPIVALADEDDAKDEGIKKEEAKKEKPAKVKEDSATEIKPGVIASTGRVIYSRDIAVYAGSAAPGVNGSA